MKKIIAIFAICLAFNFNSIAQHTAAPTYLTQQDFPDSVSNLQLSKYEGGSITFNDLLKKHKGKKIFIDFWASWCRDCFVGLPKLKELKKQTKKRKVAFVYISLDENVNKWKYAISKFKMEGEHYRMNTGWENSLTQYINLDWVPRYIVIDEDGQIIMPKAVTADNHKLIDSLID